MAEKMAETPDLRVRARSILENRTGPMRTVEQIYRVDRRRISLIKFIFEAYEGLAVVTTLDPAAGVIALRVAPGCEAVAGAVMMDFGSRFAVEPVPPDQL
jgi:hypothetical protein